MRMIDKTSLDRRALLGAGLATLAANSAEAKGKKRSPKKGKDTRKTYAIVGTGSRSKMYQDAIWGDHKDHARLVAICDTNAGRLELVQKRATTAGATAPTAYLAKDFEAMILSEKPNALIVTTPDAFHDHYIIKGLDAGLEVITEKPMTTEGGKAQNILDAVKRNAKPIRVTFNYRYAPFRSQLKQMLMDGVIGDVLSVDFHWLLNTMHGADYFRRWHSNKAISGGLMIHKATHHFDLVNWWLSDLPERVEAMGKREFYTPNMAIRLGLDGPHQRCRTCPEAQKCGFYLDLAADSALKSLYLDNESYDGYFRDRCVFRPEIDIEDTMNVMVKYRGGTTLSYSLNAFNAWEGYHIAFNGTKGRLEQTVREAGNTAGANIAQSANDKESITTRLIPMRGAPQEIEPWVGEGNHGGGDAVLLNDLFSPNPPQDALKRAADHRSGAASILIGVAANKSFVQKGPVNISDLVSGLEWPDYTSMPSHTSSVPMPPKKV